ncbi:hypothetical protein ACEPAH_3507 [Sanghuangporus vaninii]
MFSSTLQAARKLRVQFQNLRKAYAFSDAVQSRHLTSSARTSTVEQLQAAFRDKSSPFYLEPGTQGPASPGEGFVIPEQVYTLHGSREFHADAAAVDYERSAEQGRKKLTDSGFDPESFYEQRVVWGDQDPFRHVNNVRYLRYLESARMHWMLSLGRELGGEQRARDMLAGKGISLILAEISIKFRRPITYPDTLLIAHRVHDPHSTHFGCAAEIWSYAQNTVVATSDSKLVWYDYDQLKKCDPGPEIHALLARRIQT